MIKAGGAAATPRPSLLLQRARARLHRRTGGEGCGPPASPRRSPAPSARTPVREDADAQGGVEGRWRGGRSPSNASLAGSTAPSQGPARKEGRPPPGRSGGRRLLPGVPGGTDAGVRSWGDDPARPASRTPSARSSSRPQHSLLERCPSAPRPRHAPNPAHSSARKATTPEIAPRGRCLPKPLAKFVGGFLWLRIRRRSLTRSQLSGRDGFAPLAPSRKCECLRIRQVASSGPGRSP